ncbi:MAG TPA: hypothetical protein VFU12_07225 [Glycomyces sp.]|nr:hypothetical protein [Glycomyces sp.]
MSGKDDSTLHRALDWARPRRWSILGEAVLAALLALLAWPVVALDDQSDEVAVVTAYLEALREGDVEEAKSYTGEVDATVTDEAWLTEEALSSDWEIESVARRSAYRFAVHAVIGSGGRTAEALFRLEETDDGLRIANPYMHLLVPPGPLETLELNGLGGTVEEQSGDGGAKRVALFPGSYALFTSNPNFSGDGAVSFLAMPEQQLPVSLLDLTGDAFVDNAALEEQLNEDMAAWIDFCVQSTEAQPAGCPFSAMSDYGGVDDGVHDFEETGELTWAVGAYPKVRLKADLTVETVVPGWVSVSGNGIERFEDTEEQVGGRCKISTDAVTPLMLPQGRFEFTASEGLRTTCYRGL